MIRVEDQDYAIFSYSSITKTDEFSKSGHFIFSEGVVLTYQFSFHKKGKCVPCLSLSFYYRGRAYHRNIFGKEYTDIGIARKAGQFGREMVKRVENEEFAKLLGSFL